MREDLMVAEEEEMRNRLAQEEIKTGDIQSIRLDISMPTANIADGIDEPIDSEKGSIEQSADPAAMADLQDYQESGMPQENERISVWSEDTLAQAIA